MAAFSAVAKFVIGGVFGLGMYLALTPLLASILDTSNAQLIGFLTIGFIAAFGLHMLAVSTIRRTFGFGFLELGLACLTLPLTTMLLSAKIASQLADKSDQPGATLVGAGIGGAIMTGGATIIGFFLGAIFLIIALILLLNSRPQVILVDRGTGAAVQGTMQAIDHRDVDTSRWSKKDRAAYEARRDEPALRQIEATFSRPAPDLPPTPKRDHTRLEPAVLMLKVLAEAGPNGFDETASGAALDYLEAEGGTEYCRREAAGVQSWMQELR